MDVDPETLSEANLAVHRGHWIASLEPSARVRAEKSRGSRAGPGNDVDASGTAYSILYPYLCERTQPENPSAASASLVT